MDSYRGLKFKKKQKKTWPHFVNIQWQCTLLTSQWAVFVSFFFFFFNSFLFIFPDLQKSLPNLEKQIQHKLQVASKKLQKCGLGIPETAEGKMLVLIEVSINVDLVIHLNKRQISLWNQEYIRRSTLCRLCGHETTK